MQPTSSHFVLFFCHTISNPNTLKLDKNNPNKLPFKLEFLLDWFYQDRVQEGEGRCKFAHPLHFSCMHKGAPKSVPSAHSICHLERGNPMLLDLGSLFQLGFKLDSIRSQFKLDLNLNQIRISF